MGALNKRTIYYALVDKYVVVLDRSRREHGGLERPVRESMGKSDSGSHRICTTNHPRVCKRLMQMPLRRSTSLLVSFTDSQSARSSQPQ
jgi:hypothetical protein